VEPINRRRFLGNAFVLPMVALRPGELDAADGDSRLAGLARAGLDLRYTGAAPPAYRARLEHELAAIRARRGARQFLAGAEVVRFARERGIAVSPGRGAAPSALVAYALGVTGVDPITHGLIFERFLNARIAAAPDICIDVGAEGRSVVLDFAVTRLGGTPVVTGASTVLIGLGLELAGLHALTALEAAAACLDGRGRRPLDLAELPLDDPAAYARLASGDAIALPYLEPGAALRAIRPRCFEDVVAAIAQSRPGLRAAAPSRFAASEEERIAVEHPLVQPILAGTRGRVLYQEQVMQIAAQVAGYPLGDADVFCRALAKARPEKVADERERFVAGAVDAGVFRPDALRIFSWLERAAPLAFNRSHAVACALIVYGAAYLEVHRRAASPMRG
jgi:DNA polymerase III alpha subunit